MQTGAYMFGLDEAALLKYLYAVAPLCASCGYPMARLCTEVCCDTIALHCGSCQKEQHLLHRTNHLSILFLDRKDATNAEALHIQRLKTLLDSLFKHKQLMTGLIETHLELMVFLNKSIDEVEATLRQAEKKSWDPKLYDTLRRLVERKLNSAEARPLFRTQLSNMNMHQSTTVTVPSLKKLVSLHYGYGFTTTMVSQFASKITAITNSDSEQVGLSKLMQQSSSQTYLKEPLGLGVSCDPEGSRIVKLDSLGPGRCIARRVKVIGEIGKIDVRELNLRSIMPVTEQLQLPFVPSSLPQGLKKLTIHAKEHTKGTVLKSLFPNSLKFLRVKFDNLPDNKKSEIASRQIRNLSNLKVLETSFSKLTFDSLKILAEFARTRQLDYWVFSDEKLVREGVEYCNRYDAEVKGIRRMRKKAYLQVSLLSRSRYLRNMCSAFRQSLMMELEENTPAETKPRFKVTIG